MSDLLTEFFGQGNEIKPANVDPPMQSLLDNWMATIRQGGVGFLPRGRNRQTYWYAFAPSARQRRELLGLLDAWIGPTYSDLGVRRGDLESSDPFDVALASSDVPPIRFEVLPRTQPNSTQSKVAVRNALTILTRLVNERPPSQFDAMRTTVEILDDLGHAIAAGDRQLAALCMSELEQSADLDESNLAFLRIRLYAGLRDWDAIFTDPALEHVLAMRCPLGVTRAIQTALYYRRFAHLDSAGAEQDVKEAAERLELPLGSLYTGAPPTTRPVAVVELLARLADPGATLFDPALESLIDAGASLQSGLGDHLRAVVAAFFPTAEQGPGPEPVSPTSAEEPSARIADLMLDGQFAACIELGLISEPSVRAGRAMVYAARELSSTEWARKVIDYLDDHGIGHEVAATSPNVASTVEWLESARRDSPARDWEEWFAELTSTDTAPLDYSSTVQPWEPLADHRFRSLISNASDQELAMLGESGGQFLAAHSELLASPGMPDLSLRLIQALALGGKSSAGVRSELLALVESLAASDPESSLTEEAFDWSSLVIESNSGATTVGWACDILAALTTIPGQGIVGPALTFYFKTIDSLRPFRTALDGTDLETLELVAGELGTDVPDDFRAIQVQIEGGGNRSAYQYLAGKSVVLHSLTESATTRAAQILRRLVPSIDVKTNAEHVGSTHLAQLSANADVFVVVTASAKHAATTFIAMRRQSLLTVLVNSRGSSAILQALAETTV